MIENVISEFQKWCNEQDEDCPVICLHALALLKDQERELLDFIGAVAKLTAKNELYDSKCKKCGICGTEGRSEQWQK